MDNEFGKKLAKKYYNQEAKWDMDQYETSYDKYPANLIRINIIIERLKDNNIKTILDIGCGSCGPMVKLLQKGFDVYGVDFSEDTLNVGKEELEKAGFDRERVWLADIEDSTGFKSTNKFDAILALGVFPHIVDESKSLNNISALLNKGGLTFIEFRNELFAMFTFNNYSSKLFLDEIIDVGGLPENLSHEVQLFFGSKFQNKNITTKNSKLVFSDILSKFHNPLSINEGLYLPCGFSVINTLFYHYHAAPPLFRDKNRKLFNELSAKIENPYDWRGHFMASAFIIEAVVK